jgi:hypothetical protein
VSDERLLGSSEFVERTLKAAQEANEWRRRLRSDGIGLSATILEAAQNSIKSTKKQRPHILHQNEKGRIITLNPPLS